MLKPHIVLQKYMVNNKLNYTFIYNKKQHFNKIVVQ